VLTVSDLRTYFDTEDGTVRAVDGVSFSVAPGEVLGIVGESGSGKSITSMTILGLIPKPPGRIVSGTIDFRGVDLLTLKEREMRRVRGGRIAMVFQDPMTSLNPVFKVGAQIEEALKVHRRIPVEIADAPLPEQAVPGDTDPALSGLDVSVEAGLEFVPEVDVPEIPTRPMTDEEAREGAMRLFRLVGIPNPERRVDQYPHEFSGGMRQRVMIAMAIANNPDVLIADEPTTALDVTIQAQILELMKTVQEETDSSILLITHDLGVIAGMADKVVVMYAGKIVETADVETIFYQSQHPYTLGLLASLPRLDEDEQRLTPIEGTPPSLINRPPGCSFHPRCPHAQPVCRVEEPALRPVIGPGHLSACHFAEMFAEAAGDAEAGEGASATILEVDPPAARREANL
jgi:oligopeptide/dipeptide ABC transporter ATP-binding protein